MGFGGGGGGWDPFNRGFPDRAYPPQGGEPAYRFPGVPYKYTGPTSGQFIGDYTGQSGTILLPNAPQEGDVIQYHGMLYRWNGAAWINVFGEHASLSIAFAQDPFADIVEAEDGKPYPLWATGGAGTHAMSYHVTQQQIVQVTAFLEMNDEVEIPLLDTNGQPILDPANPPDYVLRHNSFNDTDYVDDPDSSGPVWSDRFANVRAITESDRRQFFAIVRQEMEPVPHWVLRIHHTWNLENETSAPRTVLVQLVGQMSGQNATQDVEVGSSGVSGHYMIRKVFFPDQGFNTPGLIARFAQPLMMYGEEFIPANNVASPTAVYLTDDGSVSGANLYSISSNNVPVVWCYGDDQLATDATYDRGSTVADWRMSSWGMGMNVDGVWQDHLDASNNTLSIQHPEFDEYMMYTELQHVSVSARWLLNVFNPAGSTNLAGQTILPATNRHFTFVAYGRKA